MVNVCAVFDCQGAVDGGFGMLWRFVVDFFIPAAALAATIWLGFVAWKTSQKATLIAEAAYRDERARKERESRVQWREALMNYVNAIDPAKGMDRRERWKLEDAHVNLGIEGALAIQLWVHNAEDILVSADHAKPHLSRLQQGLEELRRDVRDLTLPWVQTGEFDTATPFTCDWLEEVGPVWDEFHPDKIGRGIRYPT